MKTKIYRFFSPGRTWIYTLTMALLLSWTFSGNAQDFKDLDFRDKIFFGGNFGLLLGTETFINLSPVVGYRLTERFSSGLGPVYQFYSIRTFGGRYRSHIYGGRVFGSYTIIRDLSQAIPIGINMSIYAHAEYELLNIDQELLSFFISSGSGRIWLENPLVGGGFRQATGKRSSINILVLWNLNPRATALYQNPVIRFGFSF